MSESKQNESNEILEKLEAVIRHIENVKDNCILLGKRLIEEEGEFDLGKQLIANSYIHDNSKFYGIEWEFLGEQGGRSKLDLAVSQHNKTNPHHPEYWGNITEMPRVFLAEMACDWKARSEEFGTSIRDWIDDGAAKRFGYKKNDRVYKEIMYFVDLLCEKPFKQK